MPKPPDNENNSIPLPTFDVTSVSEHVCCSRGTVMNAIRRGDLEAVKYVGKWLITAQAVTQWLRRRSGYKGWYVTHDNKGDAHFRPFHCKATIERLRSIEQKRKSRL